MSQKGCAITSAAMLLDYLGVQTLPNGEELNPGTLNEYLRTEPDGFDSADVKWSGRSFKDLAGVSGVSWPFPTDEATVDAALLSGKPVILKVKGAGSSPDYS